MAIFFSTPILLPFPPTSNYQILCAGSHLKFNIISYWILTIAESSIFQIERLFLPLNWSFHFKGKGCLFLFKKCFPSSLLQVNIYIRSFLPYLAANSASTHKVISIAYMQHSNYVIMSLQFPLINLVKAVKIPFYSFPKSRPHIKNSKFTHWFSHRRHQFSMVSS